MKKDGDNFKSVEQRVSFSDVVVSVPGDDRDSLGETELDGFTNYQRQTKKKQTNQQKMCCCCISITVIVILLFLSIILIASMN